MVIYCLKIGKYCTKEEEITIGKRVRNGQLDFWKFIFTLVIVAFHGKNVISGGGTFKSGSLAVEFFFIVSGILLAQSVEKSAEYEDLGKDTLYFMKRKIKGLCPNLYVAWMVAFLVTHIGKFSLLRLIKDAARSISELLLIGNSGLRLYSSNDATWYISAMLLTMLFIYPLARKYKDTFSYIIAPCIVIFMMGYSFQNFNTLTSTNVWLEFYYKGTYRAIMEICLGCICFKIAHKLKMTNATVLFRSLLSFVEVGLYVLVIISLFRNTPGKTDWLILIVLAISITITYANIGILSSVFNHKIFSWLSAYAYSLYLGHGFWSRKVPVLFKEFSNKERFVVYAAISLVTALFIHIVSELIKYIGKKYGTTMKSWFIQEKETV